MSLGEAAGAAAAHLAAAAALRSAAGSLLGSRRRAAAAATAYLCAAAASALLPPAGGGGGLFVAAQNAALLGAVAAALVPGGAVPSAALLALGFAGWLPGAVLLAAPLALLLMAPHPAAAPSANGSSAAAPPSVSFSAAKRVAPFACAVFAMAAALPQAFLLLPPPLGTAMDAWLGRAGCRAAVPALPLRQAGGDPLHWVGARIAQQPAQAAAAAVLPAASLQPGLGLHWYLLAQSFPRFRGFFLYVLRALPAALALPLALRFPTQPRLLLAVGALARCLLHPRPQPGMAALWVGLLPLAAPQLPAGLPWLGLGLGAALALAGAAEDLWLGGSGGNANFLYGMTLAWGGLQASLLLRLLRTAARQEAGDGGGGGGGGGVASGGGGVASDGAAPAGVGSAVDQQ